MAVPKKKTRKSRRDKRRATHRIEVAAREHLPAMRTAEAAAPDVPELQAYNGREIEPLRTPAPLERVTRVAVDAMGGDRAPEEVVAGAIEAAAEGIEPILYGPKGLDTGGLLLVETTQVIGMDEKPADAVRSKPDSSLVAACRAVGESEADVRRFGGEHRSDARPLASSSCGGCRESHGRRSRS
jgi:hypothetical protein